MCGRRQTSNKKKFISRLSDDLNSKIIFVLRVYNTILSHSLYTRKGNLFVFLKKKVYFRVKKRSITSVNKLFIESQFHHYRVQQLNSHGVLLILKMLTFFHRKTKLSY